MVSLVLLAACSGHPTPPASVLAAEATGQANPPASTRVLVVDDQPTWSWRYVRLALRNQLGPSVSACVVGEAVDETRVAFPSTAAALAAYDVVVCGDFAVPGDDAAISAWCQMLGAFVRGGGGVIFVCGPQSAARWQRPEFAALLPVQAPISSVAKSPARLALATGGPIDFTGTRAGEVPAATFAALQPLGYWPVAGLAASAKAIAVADAQQPVLASLEVGRGRTVWVGSEETWRWRDPSPEVMDALWARLVQFAAAGRR